MTRSLSVGQVVGLVIVALALLTAAAGGPQRLLDLMPRDGECSGATEIPHRQSLQQARAATLCLLNAERADHDLPPLAVDARLTAAAQRHSEDMGARDFFAHKTPDGRAPSDRIFAAGVPREGSRTGENIAWGVERAATPERLVHAWMKSPGHRANILRSSFTHIGIGIAFDPPKFVTGRAVMYTTDFSG